MAKVNMKETEYYKSGKHHLNVMAARDKAIEASRIKDLERIEEYNNTSTKACEECFKLLSYKDRHKRFCNSSCSAKFNNKKRGASGWTQTDKQRAKASESMKRNQLKRAPHILSTSVFLIKCKICKLQKYVTTQHKHNKTCGADDCKVQASVGQRTYQNGSRKPVWFFNPYENKEVLLDSSWEVEIANLLIARDIKWIRPKFIKWVDSENKTRRYFSDFYLSDYDVYLDPKNPYCMTKDVEKIKKISEQVTLIVGGLDTIKEYVQML
jgi:hypothetical protein